MSCLAAERRFRLLDNVVGWEAASLEGIEGLDAATGLRLQGEADALSESDVDRYLPPPILAPGCGVCDWFLATPPWPEPRLLRLSACSDHWTPAFNPDCVPAALGRPAAVAFDRDRLAIADDGADRVLVMALPAPRIIGEATLKQPVDLSFGPRETLVVACDDGAGIEVIALSGRPLGHWPAPLPEGRVQRLAHDQDGWLWLLMRAANGWLRLHRQSDMTGRFVAADLSGLADAFAPTALVGSGQFGFTTRRGAGAVSWDWAGRPLSWAVKGSETGLVPPDRLKRQGQLLTAAIDSGIERCRWHRIRIDAEIPPRTAIEVSLATNDQPDPPPQGTATGVWAAFAEGVPHPVDWQVLEAGASDALIRQPAGRYLFVRLRLSGDGQVTPLVRRIHLDLPRATSADLLPAVYREEPRAADFTERFLALFDSGLESIDETLARLPAALDAARTDPELMPWVAGILAIAFDPAWSDATRRRLLVGAPELFRRRGTPAGLRLALELVADNGRLGAGALIVEHGLARVWGALAPASSAGHRGSSAPSGARLGVTRLFSRSAARLRLGSSRIGQAPVLSYGNPNDDAHETGAFRFSVDLPADVPLSEQSLRALVDSQKPAHTIAAVRRGDADGFLVSGRSRLGVDTLVRRPMPLTLRTGAVRLGAGSVLGGSPPPVVVLGHEAAPSHSWSAGSMCE